MLGIEPQAGGADREVAAAAGPLRIAGRPVQQFDGDRVARDTFKAGRKLGDGAGAVQRLAAYDGLLCPAGSVPSLRSSPSRYVCDGRPVIQARTSDSRQRI